MAAPIRGKPKDMLVGEHLRQHRRAMHLIETGSAVDAMAFSPDGHTLAIGNHDGITRLWNLNVHDAIERICATAGDLTLQQWHDYIPQMPYQPLRPR